MMCVFSWVLKKKRKKERKKLVLKVSLKQNRWKMCNISYPLSSLLTDFWGIVCCPESKFVVSLYNDLGSN